ncbi:MAG: hypothetical protein COT73_04605 [Bdellovibrio sp. CG10_big_fil_rev_8_21_14_0_10_47_8]|nr:MAG: hypothetical protein COT73_04605 [Bdellovibrio sp. CG10_big_fil_rev_8_21_14_0_10_47_8]
MKIDQRSYSGPAFRPSPMVLEEKLTETLLIATSWGESNHAQITLDLVKDFLLLSQDPDATTLGMSPEGSDPLLAKIHAGLVRANETLFQRENSQEYLAAVEFAAISVEHGVLSWIQIGAPHLLIINEKGLQPVCYSPDLAAQWGQLSPLLARGLGLERVCPVNSGTYRLKKGDHVVLVSRSDLPANFYQQQAADLSSLSQSLIDDNSEMPFWIAICEF